MEELTHIPLKKLRLSASNPRTTHNDESVGELSRSIDEMGVLQPIIVRPVTNGKKKEEFEVVCGERRFLAARQSNLISIPAFVRELTDHQALEVTITENLQRKDITILEEVGAFCTLVENGYTVQDISVRFAKPERFVRLRLKLAQMIAPFKELLGQSIITPAIAEAIATMTPPSQQLLFDRYFSLCQTSDHWRCPTLRQVNEFKRSSFQADLGQATFDPADRDLLPQAGACTQCPNNTDNDMVLFSSEEESGKCLNVPCFLQKNQLAFTANLTRIQEEEPQVVMGYEHNIYGDEKTEVGRLIESGVEAVELDRAWTPIEPPEQVDLQELSEQEQQIAIGDYAAQVVQYQQELQNPDAIKVFMLSGQDKGKTLLFKYNPAVPAPSGGAAQGIQLSLRSQIAKLQEKAKRTAEISFEKIYEAARDVMEDKLSRYTSLSSPLTRAEKTAFHVALLDFMEPELRAELTPGNYNLGQSGKEFASELPEGLSVRLVRSFIKSRTRVSNATFEKSKAECLVEVVTEHFPGSFLSDRDRIATTYQKRLDKLGVMIRELTQALADDAVEATDQAASSEDGDWDEAAGYDGQNN